MAYGGVHEPPGRAARGLIEWATDMWPYVNGKSLMSGLDLLEMEASETLDVIHFLFEEDSHHVSEESAKSRSDMRSALYRDLYGKEYKYKYTSRSSSSSTSTGRSASASGVDLDEWGTFSDVQAESLNANQFKPRERETKPYIPPTNVNANSPVPFGGALDAPLN